MTVLCPLCGKAVTRIDEPFVKCGHCASYLIFDSEGNLTDLSNTEPAGAKPEEVELQDKALPKEAATEVEEVSVKTADSPRPSVSGKIFRITSAVIVLCMLVTGIAAWSEYSAVKERSENIEKAKLLLDEGKTAEAYGILYKYRSKGAGDALSSFRWVSRTGKTSSYSFERIIDENGRVVKENRKYNGLSSNFDRTVTYTYTPDGQLKEEAIYSSYSNKPASRTVYYYDKGKLVSAITYELGPLPTVEQCFIYEGDRLVCESIRYCDKEKNGLYYNKYSHNSDGTVKRYESYRGDILQSYVEYFYSNDSLTTEKLYVATENGSFKLDNTTKYEYDGKKNITLLSDKYGEHVYKYDSDGRMISDVFASSVSGQTTTDTYKYDKYGNLIRIIRQRESGGTETTEEYGEYECYFDP